MRKRKSKNNTYTPEDFYRFGQQEFTKQQIADHYEIVISAAYAKFKVPELKAAYEEGKNNKPLPHPETISDLPTSVAPFEKVSREAELSYEDVEQAIFRAIDAHCCTVFPIKLFNNGIDARFDIFDILEEMVVEKKLTKLDNGRVMAYFRPEWKVVKFYLNGDHKVAIIREGDEAKDEVQTEPRFKEVIEQITENGHSRESIEKVKTAMVQSAKVAETPVEMVSLVDLEIEPNGEDIPAPRGNFKTIGFKTVEMGGGRLFVSFDGNIFEIGRETRQKLNEIIDLVQGL